MSAFSVCAADYGTDNEERSVDGRKQGSTEVRRSSGDCKTENKNRQEKNFLRMPGLIKFEDDEVSDYFRQTGGEKIERFLFLCSLTFNQVVKVLLSR